MYLTEEIEGGENNIQKRKLGVSTRKVNKIKQKGEKKKIGAIKENRRNVRADPKLTFRPTYDGI